MTTVSAFTLTRLTDTRTADRAHWHEDAACAEVGPHVFEPDDHGTPHPDAWDRARSICAGCPVRYDCLEDALATEPRGARFGMRGGMTPDERQAIYRRRGRIPGARR